MGARRGRNVVRVGITDFAQDALGDVVYVDVPDVGTEVTAGAAVRRGRVDQVRLRRVQPDRPGSIVERNPLLDEHPELVNEQPYGDGWMVVIEPVGCRGSWTASSTPRPTGRSSKRARLVEPTVELQDDRGLRHSTRRTG